MKKQLGVMCIMVEVHNTTREVVLLSRNRNEPEPGQVSGSTHQFIGNTQPRGTGVYKTTGER